MFTATTLSMFSTILLIADFVLMIWPSLRQVTVYNQQATQAATQAPAVTTFMMNKQIGATVTYAAIVYTQTFADVPDQLPSPIPGTIGLGNLVKQGGDGAKNKKREAQPTAGIAGRIGR